MRTTPIDRAKARMGYQNANARPSCRNCGHSTQEPSGGMYPWYCTKGLFGTTALAVCNEHEPHQKGGAS